MASSLGTIFKAMADPTRQRILEVLSRQELSVSELVDVLRMPQSTVSRHLKVLREAGLVVDRRIGPAVLHAAQAPRGADVLPASPGRRAGALSGSGSRARANGRAASELRERLLEWAAQEPLDSRTRERIERVIQRRRQGKDDFFERTGTRWDQLRIEAFGEAFHLEALSTLLPAEWTVADIGAGTGYLLPVLAARFRRVIAVEPVAAMLEVARKRPALRGATNVEFRTGALDRLPIETAELDLAIGSLVLHHVPEPESALRELHRCLRPGGRILIVEQASHEYETFYEHMGDLWWGFQPEQLCRWAQEAGFVGARAIDLDAVRPSGRNSGQVPRLFALTASTELPPPKPLRESPPEGATE